MIRIIIVIHRNNNVYDHIYLTSAQTSYNENNNNKHFQ